jgi:hypothetical protein
LKNSAGSFAVALRALGQLLRALILVNNGMDNLIAKIYTNAHAWTACVRSTGLDSTDFRIYTEEAEDAEYSVVGLFNQAGLDQVTAWLDANTVSYYLKDSV